jgi:hypothetical protein
MANSFRIRRGAAILHFTLDRRQLQLRVTGLLTPAFFDETVDDIDRVARGALVKSIVLDYSAAVLAISSQTLRDGRLRLSPRVRALPIALVPPAVSFGEFREIAYLAATDGLVRGVFPGEELAQAQDWALRKEDVCPRAYPHSEIRAIAL